MWAGRGNFRARGSRASSGVNWIPPSPEREDLEEQGFQPNGQFAMEVVTTSGRAASVELRIRSETVEIWHHDCCIAVFDRRALRTWLAEPLPEPLMAGEVTFSLDRSVDSDGRVAVSLPDVLVWTLAPAALDVLRRRV
jgi:hypothetical protein